MADIPRDPRQLARDILAGKISIEDLARERARQAGAAGGAVPLPSKQPWTPPDKIPLPRTEPVQTPQASPPPPPRPVARPTPPPSPHIPQRPVQRPPVAIQTPQRRPVQQPVQPMARVQSPPEIKPAEIPVAEETPTVSKTASQITVGGAKLDVSKIMKNRTALRQCLVMAEVLGKPLALRD